MASVMAYVMNNVSSRKVLGIYDNTYRNLETIFLGTELSKKTWNKT